ncbi:MAG: signal peptidase I [Treponema sp.]|jgi:signal peptidase I|nr:signal peptidase I [Treponema sp.]
MAVKGDFFDAVEAVTEGCLSRRRWKRRIKKEKQQAKNPVLDWIEAFLWAAGVVLLINQYLFQAYQIPSGSMIDTLLIGDRVFVNKIVYGPELLPGLAKIPSPVKPKRNDIIIFENPSYISRGPVFDIAQRIIYMLTISLVDIDRDEAGQPKAHFLIKRAAGMEGDLFRTDRGNMTIRFAGESRWIDEAEFNRGRNWKHNLSRLMEADAYPGLEAAGRIAGFLDLGLSPPADLGAAAESVRNLRYPDYLFHEKARLELLRAAYPQDGRYSMLLARHTQGWYVPESRILPLGDNRDNSRDGRFFGPVRASKILGKGSVIYWSWPRLGRIGPIR